MNGFIRHDGKWEDVPNTQHASNFRPKKHAIRVSCPERRRTWYGIEVHAQTVPAWRTLLGKLWTLQLAGKSVIFVHEGTTIEQQAGETFGKLRRYVRQQIAAGEPLR